MWKQTTTCCLAQHCTFGNTFYVWTCFPKVLHNCSAQVFRPPRAKMPSQAQWDVWWETAGDYWQTVPPRNISAIGKPWDKTCVYVVEEPGAVGCVPLRDPVSKDQLLCGRNLHQTQIRSAWEWETTSSSATRLDKRFGSRRDDPPSSLPTTASGCRADLWYGGRQINLEKPQP